MYGRLEQIYYVLAAVVLTAGLFVLTESKIAEVTAFQNEIKTEFKIAFLQTIGDQPVLADVELIAGGVNDFYVQAADELIAMFSQPETDQDVIYVFGRVYNTFAQAVHQIRAGEVATQNDPMIAANFMTEPPVYNIVPENWHTPETFSVTQPKIAGVSTYKPEILAYPQANVGLPWVTLKDNVTGELYCTAIYNGEVNKYVGPCKDEYH